MRKTIAALVALAAIAVPAQAEDITVDLELLLAVDASGSVNDEEFLLQLGGVAAAFRDPEVHDAIASGPEGRIAAALMIWSDAASRKAVSDWAVIDGPAAANAFADTILAQIPRRRSFLGKTGTGIGAAIGHGLRVMARNGLEGARKTIDVSGDGPETRLMFGEAMALPEARRRADRAGVVINGLAILSDDPHLDIYYGARVISGPGSFVMAAADFEDFRRAMRLKLVREIRMLIGETESVTRFAAGAPEPATPTAGPFALR
ncbi:MAG: DUF1194 domain-containing protein [Pseudomonadota bacterium]